MLVFPMPHVQDSNRSNNLFIAFCHLTSHSYNLSFRESVEGERERESVSQTKNLQHTSHIQNGSDVPALVTGQYMKYNWHFLFIEFLSVLFLYINDQNLY